MPGTINGTPAKTVYGSQKAVVEIDGLMEGSVFMAVTISTHNGSAVRVQHNIRNEKIVAKQKHIDPAGHFEIWHHENERDAYHRIFDGAIERYNLKQKRKDRKITNYYKMIEKDEKKHPVYEMIIGVYGKDDNGELLCPVEVSRKIMKEFTETWVKRNPNLELIGAYYHADEEGEPHVHLDYIPVAHGYKNGMDTQNGLVKALGEMGFMKTGKQTAQILWEARENEVLESICILHGFDVMHPEKEKGKRHLHTETYKAKKELQAVQQSLKASEEKLAETEEEITEKRFEKELIEFNIDNVKRNNDYLISVKSQTQIDLMHLDTEIADKKKKIKLLESEKSDIQKEYDFGLEEIKRLRRESEELSLKIKDQQKQLNDAEELEKFRKDIQEIFVQTINIYRRNMKDSIQIIKEKPAKEGIFGYSEAEVTIRKDDYLRLVDFISHYDHARVMYKEITRLFDELKISNSRIQENWRRAKKIMTNEQIAKLEKELESVMASIPERELKKDKEIEELQKKMKGYGEEIIRIKAEKEARIQEIQEQYQIMKMVASYYPDEWNRMVENTRTIRDMESAYEKREIKQIVYTQTTIITYAGEQYTREKFLELYKAECEKQNVAMNPLMKQDLENVMSNRNSKQNTGPLFHL